MRIAHIDSLKGFLTIVVVLGHIIGGYRESHLLSAEHDILRYIFNFIYGFHMPAFILLNGYVARYAFVTDEGIVKVRKLAIQTLNLVFVYLVFRCIGQNAG